MAALRRVRRLMVRDQVTYNRSSASRLPAMHALLNGKPLCETRRKRWRDFPRGYALGHVLWIPTVHLVSVNSHRCQMAGMALTILKRSARVCL